MIIIDVDEPKTCAGCPFEFHERCFLNKKKVTMAILSRHKHRSCPIKGTIPDIHGRLIDESELLQIMSHPRCNMTILQCINSAQTIIEPSTRKEQG